MGGSASQAVRFAPLRFGRLGPLHGWVNGGAGGLSEHAEVLRHAMDYEYTLLFRLVVATLLAAALGWERESMGKSAGLRTHILVAIGAALFVGLGHVLVNDFSSFGDRLRFDPTRVLEAVVTGVSFLGAGTIFLKRGEAQVRGLTTAASLWTTAGVGLAVGLGRYVLALGATLLVFVVLRALGRIEASIECSRRQK